MNYKIESNFLYITNYPYVAEHFEEMARQGWMIKKILLGTIFIYQRTEPRDLEFAISPYEVESFLNRKSREDLNEFHGACEYVGWKYITRSYDLHVYSKEAGTEAVDIDTDEEAVFYNLKAIGRKYSLSSYVNLFLFLFLLYFNLGALFGSVDGFKSNLQLFSSFILIIGLLLLFLQLIHIKRFLKQNQKRIEHGDQIEFKNSKFYSFRILFALSFVTVACILGSIFIFNKNYSRIALLPVGIGVLVGLCYRFLIKPRRIDKKKKGIYLILTILLAMFLSQVLFGKLMFRTKIGEDTGLFENNQYNLISVKDVSKDGQIDRQFFEKNHSVLVPLSFRYNDANRSGDHITMEYSKARTEGIAEYLYKKYIQNAENALLGEYGLAIDNYADDSGEFFEKKLLDIGFTKGELKELEKKSDREIKELLSELCIKNIDDKKGTADEGVYLSALKDAILIRKGREVFYLDGADFSDENIMSIIRDKLKLQ